MCRSSSTGAFQSFFARDENLRLRYCAVEDVRRRSRFDELLWKNSLVILSSCLRESKLSLFVRGLGFLPNRYMIDDSFVEFSHSGSSFLESGSPSFSSALFRLAQVHPALALFLDAPRFVLLPTEGVRYVAAAFLALTHASSTSESGVSGLTYVKSRSVKRGPGHFLTRG